MARDYTIQTIFTELTDTSSVALGLSAATRTSCCQATYLRNSQLRLPYWPGKEIFLLLLLLVNDDEKEMKRNQKKVKGKSLAKRQKKTGWLRHKIIYNGITHISGKMHLFPEID